MSADQLHHLIKMANQIAANFAYEKDPERAARAVAEHMQRFWSPTMRKDLRAYAAGDGAALQPVARAAAAALRVPD
jgi:formate dehydrogenase subunit delta